MEVADRCRSGFGGFITLGFANRWLTGFGSRIFLNFLGNQTQCLNLSSYKLSAHNLTQLIFSKLSFYKNLQEQMEISQALSLWDDWRCWTILNLDRRPTRGLVFGVAWIQICMAEKEEKEKLEEDGFLRHEIRIWYRYDLNLNQIREWDWVVLDLSSRTPLV